MSDVNVYTAVFDFPAWVEKFEAWRNAAFDLARKKVDNTVTAGELYAHRCEGIQLKDQVWTRDYLRVTQNIVITTLRIARPRIRMRIIFSFNTLILCLRQNGLKEPPLEILVMIFDAAMKAKEDDMLPFIKRVTLI